MDKNNLNGENAYDLTIANIFLIQSFFFFFFQKTFDKHLVKLGARTGELPCYFKTVLIFT